MLDFLRKRKRSWIITFLLGLIIIVFIAFYGGSGYRDYGSPDVAEINGEKITQREFAFHYQRTLERYRELLKGSLSPEMLKNLNLKANLLEELIQKKLVLQEARSLGLRVTDEELVNLLAQIPDFQVAGRFNKAHYLQLLRANRLTPIEFEEAQREQLTMQRLYALILDSVHVTDKEVRDQYRFQQEKINLRYIRLPLGKLASEIKVTEEEIKKYYDRNKESLKEPLRIRVEYLAYPFDRFGTTLEVTVKEIEEYYQANRDSKFYKPKEAKVRYILIRSAVGADTKENARARADRVVAEARSGKDFAQLATRESDDPTSAKGGDIGWVTQGQLPPALEKTIFSLAKGQISDKLETPEGFQIFKVEEIKEEKRLTLAEATPEIARTLKSEKAKQETARVADRDREKALSGTDFDKLAQDHSLTVNVTRWFATGEILPEIGPIQDFYRSAFALGAKELSPVIEGKNVYYLFRLKERKEATVPPLENVMSEIEKRLKDSKADEQLREKANLLLDQLKKEKDIGKVAAQNGLKVEETGWFSRNATQLPRIGQLPEFTASGIVLSAQKSIPDRIYTQKDAAYIFAFKESQKADMEQFAKEKDNLTKQLVAENQQRILQKFIEGLKAKAKIEINSASLAEG